MPKTVKMPELHDVHVERKPGDPHRRHVGWFVRGFFAAALAFAAFLAINSFVGTARTSEAGHTIIVGH